MSQNDLKTKTLNTGNLKYLLTNSGATDYKGFICNFDVTGALMDGDNTYKLYLYTAQLGTGSTLSFCKLPANVGATDEVLEVLKVEAVAEVIADPAAVPPVAGVPAVEAVAYVAPQAANPGTPSLANSCEFWANFDDNANKLTGYTTTSNGFDLNIIQIKRNAADNTQIDVKVNTDAAWVNNFSLNNNLIKF
jgi:hypothetical protein